MTGKEIIAGENSEEKEEAIQEEIETEIMIQEATEILILMITREERVLQDIPAEATMEEDKEPVDLVPETQEAPEVLEEDSDNYFFFLNINPTIATINPTTAMNIQSI